MASYQRSTYPFDAEYSIAGEGEKRVYHVTLKDPSGKHATKTFHTSAKPKTGKHPCTESWPGSNERCPASYCSPALLKEHVALFHRGLPLLCNLCPRLLGDRSGAETHAKLHREGARYQCPLCTHCAQRRDNVLRHINTQHDAVGAEPVDLKKTLGDNLPPRVEKRRRQALEEGDSGSGDNAPVAPMGPEPKRQQLAPAVEDTALVDDIIRALWEEAPGLTEFVGCSVPPASPLPPSVPSPTLTSTTNTNTALATPLPELPLDWADPSMDWLTSPSMDWEKPSGEWLGLFDGQQLDCWGEEPFISDPFLPA